MVMPPIADASKLGQSQCRPNSRLDKAGYAGSPGLNAIIPLQRVNPVYVGGRGCVPVFALGSQRFQEFGNCPLICLVQLFEALGHVARFAAVANDGIAERQ